MVVATVPTIQPLRDINEFAVKMFENGGRGIGQKGKDNGVLIVLALKDRQVRIEVGYDLEEFITDGFAGETIREVITPEFRNGDYGAGLLAGATRIINRIADARGVELQDVPRERQPMQRAPRIRLLAGDPDRLDHHHDAVEPRGGAGAADAGAAARGAAGTAASARSAAASAADLAAASAASAAVVAAEAEASADSAAAAAAAAARAEAGSQSFDQRSRLKVQDC